MPTAVEAWSLNHWTAKEVPDKFDLVSYKLQLRALSNKKTIVDILRKVWIQLISGTDKKKKKIGKALLGWTHYGNFTVLCIGRKGSCHLRVPCYLDPKYLLQY